MVRLPRWLFANSEVKSHCENVASQPPFKHSHTCKWTSRTTCLPCELATGYPESRWTAILDRRGASAASRSRTSSLLLSVSNGESYGKIWDELTIRVIITAWNIDCRSFVPSFRCDFAKGSSVRLAGSPSGFPVRGRKLSLFSVEAMIC